MTSTLLVIFIIGFYFVYSGRDYHSRHVTKEKNSKIQQKDNKNRTISKEYSAKIKSPLQINKEPKIIKAFDGTTVDGSINFDENGNVLIDKDLKNLFDYFMIATGELTPNQMRQKLIDYAAENLTEKQLQQLLKIYDKYQAYLASQDSLDARMSNELSQAQRLAILSQYRKDFLGEEFAQAFFADEEAYAEFVLNNKTPDNENSEQQNDWLEAQNRATAYQDTVIENQNYAQSPDISAQEIYQNRVQQYGSEAANRLKTLDQQRQQWQNTVDDYFSQRQLIDSNQNSINLEQLDANYSPQELKRLQALWRIEHE